MKLFYRLCSFAALAAVVVGCCNCRALRKSQRPLVGTDWRLVQLGGRTVKADASDPERFTMRFEEAERQADAGTDGNRVYGTGACNRFFGTFRLGEKRALTIGDMGSTRMMCPDIETESAFFEALLSVTHYDMDGPMLMLFSNGELSAIFQARGEKTDDETGKE